MRRAFLLPLLLTVAACATAPANGPRRSPSVLTADEMAELPVITAYDAIQRMRPQWLSHRSSPTASNPRPDVPIVYMDGVRWGEAYDLRNVRVENIESMRYLNSRDATNRFGIGHTGGAILVTTVQGRE